MRLDPAPVLAIMEERAQRPQETIFRMGTKRLSEPLCRRSTFSQQGIGPFTNLDLTHSGNKFRCQVVGPLCRALHFWMRCQEPPTSHQERVIHIFWPLQRR